MNRRDFLVRAAAAVAAVGIDPELLVWQPKAMITVPAMPYTGWHPGLPLPFDAQAIARMIARYSQDLDDFVVYGYIAHDEQGRRVELAELT